MISIQRLDLIRNAVNLRALEEGIPNLTDPLLSTNPMDVFQYGQVAYQNRQQRKEERQAPQDTYASSTLSRPMCQQNGCCPSCR
ncbi:MAG: hypothetical protein ACK551_04170 [Vampirovibrionales bacterium]